MQTRPTDTIMQTIRLTDTSMQTTRHHHADNKAYRHHHADNKAYRHLKLCQLPTADSPASHAASRSDLVKMDGWMDGWSSSFGQHYYTGPPRERRVLSVGSEHFD